MLTSPDDWPAARDKLLEIWAAGLDTPEINGASQVMTEHDADMWMRSGREIMGGYERVGSPTGRGPGSIRRFPCCTLYGQPRDPAFLAAQEEFAASHPWFTVRKLAGPDAFRDDRDAGARGRSAIDEFVRQVDRSR